MPDIKTEIELQPSDFEKLLEMVDKESVDDFGSPGSYFDNDPDAISRIIRMCIRQQYTAQQSVHPTRAGGGA